LAKLDPQTRVLPGHDYGPTPEATLGDQRQSNPYLKLDSVGDFVAYRMKPRG
jgi:glyoxylase-like metal-dependent hydrolase (beta-lactamase superfamily II)